MMLDARVLRRLGEKRSVVTSFRARFPTGVEVVGDPHDSILDDLVAVGLDPSWIPGPDAAALAAEAKRSYLLPPDEQDAPARRYAALRGGHQPRA